MNRLRAALAVFMLASFYLVAGAIVTALAGVTWWIWLNHPGALAAKLSFVTVAVAAGIGLALIRALSARPEPPLGRALEPAEAPQLWQIVRELAEIANTSAPQEIVLVGDVNAAVSEDARLLGLLGGRRRLYLGAPLLIGLDVTQLRSVLAHELGHYSAGHTRLGAINYRGRVAVLGTLEGLSGKVSGWLLRLYAALYFLVEAAVSRRQELEADQASVSAVGSAAAAGALGELPVLDAAWDYYLDTYVALGWEDGLAPQDVFGGFAAVLAARSGDLEELRRQAPPEHATRWDSHPPIATRIATMAGMTGPDLPRDTRPAHSLLPDFDRLSHELGRALAAAQGKALVGWDELTATSVQAAHQREADRIYRVLARLAATPTGDLGSLLTLVEAGRVPELTHALFPHAAGQEAAEQLTEAVRVLLAAALVRSGRAQWRHSWVRPAELVRPDGSSVELDELAALLTCRDTLEQGRSRLAAEQIDIDQARQLERSVSGHGAEVVGGLANVKVDGEQRDLLILSAGLVLVPCPKRSDGGKQRLAALAALSPTELVARYGLLAFEDVAQARVVKDTPIGLQLRLYDGRTLTLQETWTGDRLTKDSDELLAALATRHGAVLSWTDS